VSDVIALFGFIEKFNRRGCEGPCSTKSAEKKLSLSLLSKAWRLRRLRTKRNRVEKDRIAYFENLFLSSLTRIKGLAAQNADARPKFSV